MRGDESGFVGSWLRCSPASTLLFALLSRCLRRRQRGPSRSPHTLHRPRGTLILAPSRLQCRHPTNPRTIAEFGPPAPHSSPCPAHVRTESPAPGGRIPWGISTPVPCCAASPDDERCRVGLEGMSVFRRWKAPLGLPGSSSEAPRLSGRPGQ